MTHPCNGSRFVCSIPRDFLTERSDEAARPRRQRRHRTRRQSRSFRLGRTYLVVGVEDGEVADGEDHLVQQLLVRVVPAVPDEMRRDVAQLERRAVRAQQVLQSTQVLPMI